MKLIADRNEVTGYIPQRSPMVMIHQLIAADEKHTVSGLVVENGNVFHQDGFLSESGLLENIAQTAAAGVGYRCRINNEKVPVGFIAAIRDLIIRQLPPVGSALITEVENMDEIMGVSIIRGTVRLNDEVIAQCEMRIFIKPD